MTTNMKVLKALKTMNVLVVIISLCCVDKNPAVLVISFFTGASALLFTAEIERLQAEEAVANDLYERSNH